MSVTVNMLQEHCGGRLSVPATMHRSLRFSGLIPFGDEPGARDCVAFPGSSVEGFALYCGRAEVAVAFLKEHPLAYALIVHARQEACQVPASCVSHVLLLRDDRPLSDVVEDLSRLFFVYEQWLGSMKAALLKGGGYQELLDCSEAVFDDFVSVTDSAYQLLAHTSQVPADDEAAAYLVEKGYHSKETVDKFKKYHAIQRWKTQVGIQRIERTLVVAQPTLSYVFRMHGSYFVHVVLQCTHSRITEALVDRFQMLIDYMEVYARHDWSSQQQFGTASSKVLRDLVMGKSYRGSVMEARLRHAGLKVRGRFVAAVLELEGDEGESGEGLAGYCAWRLSEHVPWGKISVIDGKIVLLLDAEQEEGGLGKAQGALEVFLRTYGGVMGVSEVFADIADISFAYKQACLAIWYGCKRRISLAEQCEAEENAAGIYAFAPYLASLVFDVERRDGRLIAYCAKQSVVARIVAFDRLHNTNDAELLYRYLTCERRAVQAAEALHVHRNTLMYRIERMQERFAIDLDDAVVRRNLLLAYSLLEA